MRKDDVTVQYESETARNWKDRAIAWSQDGDEERAHLCREIAESVERAHRRAYHRCVVVDA